MNITEPLFGLAGLGDFPLADWFFVPFCLVGGGPSSAMIAVQGGGLAVLTVIVVWLFRKQRTRWGPRRFLLFAAYPAFIFATNLAAIA